MSHLYDILKMTVNYDIQIYQTSNGNRPFEKWLASLKDINARAKIRQRISRTTVDIMSYLCDNVS